MSEPDKEAKLKTIRALLAKAESTNYPAEAEAILEQVSILVAKYGIEEALLAEQKPLDDKVIRIDIPIPAPYGMDKIILISRICLPLNCQLVRRGTSEVNIFGFPGDVSRVQLLYQSLLVQMMHGLARAEPTKPYWEDLKSWKKSWMNGFSLAIFRRLTDAKNAAEEKAEADKPNSATEVQRRLSELREEATTAQESGNPTEAARILNVLIPELERAPITNRSVELVVADRQHRVKESMAESFPKLGKAQGRKLHGSGNRNGYQAGQRANLGEKSLGT